MKNRKGFYLANILFKISIVLLLINIGFAHINRQNEKKEIIEAKVKIYDTFSTYANMALENHQGYTIILDYKTKEIRVYTNADKLIEKTLLPKNLYYTTVFKEKNSFRKKQSEFEATITKNGNITPSFSVYIFDYSKIARSRISFYGFQTIKFIKINLYKNHRDKKATYENIVAYHEKLKKKEEYFHTYWSKE